MLQDRERAAIDALWTVKISQDARDLPQAQRCRNLEPDSADFICALAAGIRAIVVANKVLSHALWDYVGHVRAVPGVQSLTLPVGKGLEVSRVGLPPRVGG